MASSVDHRVPHTVRKSQFLAVLLSIALVSSILGVLGAGLAFPIVGAAGATAKALPETFKELPSELEVVPPAEESRLLDSKGRVIARFFSDRRIVIGSDQIPDVMKDAIVAIEDRRFYYHHGVDPDGMARALVNNLTSGKTQGASTITQQYVKNMLMEQGIQAGDQDLIDEATEVTPERKLREARYALAIESKMTKDEILTGYLNLATFGANIYGVEAASRAYFSKSASDLSLSQSALLAGTVQSPIEFDPLLNPEEAQERRDVVLNAMLSEGYISEEERDKAVKVDVKKSLKPENRVSGCQGAGSSAYFCSFVVAEFLEDETFGKDRAERDKLLHTGGLTLRTTLDRDKQKAAYKAVTDRVNVGDSSGLNTALVSLVPDTGHIVAMAQNTHYGVATEDDPTATEVSFAAGPDRGGGNGFPAGSTFKVFTLVEWFNQGRFAYDTVGGGSRTKVNGSFQCHGKPLYTEAWNVGDLPGKDGSMSVVRATKISANQAFADMAMKTDLCEIFDRAAEMGATQANGEVVEPFAPNLIGASSITPLAMASAFGTLADNGTRCEPMALKEVEDRDGNVLKSYSPECAPAIDANVAKQTTQVLNMALDGSGIEIGRPLAGKTGTTDKNANTWFVGYTPQLVTAAWAGFSTDSSRSANGLVINGQYHDTLYGATFVAPMFTQYMRSATADDKVRNFDPAFIGNKPQPKPTPAPAAPKKDSNQQKSSDSTGSSKKDSNQQKSSDSTGSSKKQKEKD